jgi:hypothetical protein
MALHPAGPTLGRLLLVGRGRGWDGDGYSAISEGYAVTAERLIDRLKRRSMGVEDGV